MSRRLPNILIIGVMKAGTTTLYTWLRSHPAICTPRYQKEIRYFYPAAEIRPLPPLEDYITFFAHCPPDTTHLLEASPAYYLGGERIINAIQSTLGDDVKLICILREPVSRFISLWRYHIAQMLIDRETSLAAYYDRCRAFQSSQLEHNLLDYYAALESGKYDVYLAPWLAAFHQDQLRILFLDDLHSNPQQILAELGRWLEIDPTGFVPGEAANVTVNYHNAILHRLVMAIRQHGNRFFETFPAIRIALRDAYYHLNGDRTRPEIDPAIRAELQVIYAPHNRRLADCLRDYGIEKLPVWLTV